MNGALDNAVTGTQLSLHSYAFESSQLEPLAYNNNKTNTNF